jgi:hypothetical protein
MPAKWGMSFRSFLTYPCFLPLPVLACQRTVKDSVRYERPEITGFWCTSADSELSRSESRICPEPDSNRHGLAAEGFSYSLQLSLLSLATHLESGLSLCHSSAPGGALKVRQGPSSLYTFPRAGGARGLSSGLQAPRSRRWGCFPEFDPIHTGCFRAGCSTLFKSLASTDFATRASGGADSKPCLGTGWSEVQVVRHGHFYAWR